MSIDKIKRRKRRVRHAIKTRAKGRVRMSVFRSNKNIYVQLIDDEKHVTLAQASTQDKELAGIKNGSNIEAAKKVGELIAKKAKELKLTKIVFDRGNYLFHGRVKMVADAAREAGLSF